MSVINPMDRPCCANCKCLMIRNQPDEDFRRQLEFVITVDCPHKNESPFRLDSSLYYSLRSQIDNNQVTVVSNLFDFVCNSWEGRGEPFNLDEKEKEK